MATPYDSSNHESQLRETRRRLTLLEAETHRIRAELARLEAADEDAAAEQLEAELRQHEEEIKQQQQAIEPSPPSLPKRLPASSPDRSASSSSRQRIETPNASPPSDGVNAHKHGDDTADEPSEIVSFSLQANEDKPPAEKPRRGRLPAWAVSLAVHVVLLLTLGAASFATLVDAPNLLLASAVDGEDDLIDEISEIDFDEVSDEDLQLDELVSEFDTADFNEIELSETDAPWTNTDSLAVTPASFDAMPSDIGSLMTGVEAGGGAGEGGESPQAGGGPRGGARFFGARSKGGRFVFIVDNSGSMQQGRLETTLMEIERSVGKMSKDQQFHVLFYSDQAYPMFYPDPTDKLEPATRENKQKLSQWLRTVEMCVGGRLRDAMQLAEGMKPDTVFLLSDGKIGSGTMRFMTEANEWSFVINTLGMTVPDQEAAANLLAIAEAHNGLFFPVGVNPIAARMAQQQPIPYRNTTSGPGPVWGTRVQKSRR